MAELTHFYAEQNTEQTTQSDTFVDVSGVTITGLAASTKYLIIARALSGSNNPTQISRLRVETPDDTTIESKSEAITEFEQTGVDANLVYFFAHSFTTAATPSDVNFQFRDDGATSTTTVDQLSLLLLDLDAVGTEGTDYFEDIQAVDTGTEYSTTANTTVLAQLLGTDLNQDEQLILGYGRADVGSGGRWFDISVQAADDTATSAVRSRHRAEGEDTAEQRIVGFGIRHKASSGTPNVTIYGREEATNGNMTDGGAYLIALPTSLFADFEHDFVSGNIAADGETTIATVGPYTPAINGNHMIFGVCQNSSPDAGLTQMWVEDGTTEIRTGDSTPSHTQNWDTAKDTEGSRTFQRHSISAAITLNLQADRNAAGPNGVGLRWLVVVNLNEPGAPATVYPPFPRRRQTTVRM